MEYDMVDMNRYLDKVQKSASVELMALAREMTASGKDIVSLAGGEPDFDTPQKIKDIAIEQIQSGNTHYAVGPGIPEQRERISEK